VWTLRRSRRSGSFVVRIAWQQDLESGAERVAVDDPYGPATPVDEPRGDGLTASDGGFPGGGLRAPRALRREISTNPTWAKGGPRG
jgi:hypothetical protein